MADLSAFRMPSAFQALFEAIPEPYLVLAPDGSVMAFNNAFLHTTAVDRQTLSGCNFFEFSSQDFSSQDFSSKHHLSGEFVCALKTLQASFEAALQRRSPQTVTLPFYPLLGQRIKALEANQKLNPSDWTITHIPVFDADDRILYVLHRLQQSARPTSPEPTEPTALLQPSKPDPSESDPSESDPSELNSQPNFDLQQKLGYANTILATLFQEAPIGIGIWDENLRFVRLNEALADLYGLPSDFPVGQTIEELLPTTGTETAQILRQVIETRKPILNQKVNSLVSTNGKQRYWRIHYHPIKLSPEITWVSAIGEEITEEQTALRKREQTEAELREGEARFQLLAENSTDIISRQSTDGILLYVSPACYPVLGYHPEDLVGHPSKELIHPDDLNTIIQSYPIDRELPAIYTITHRTRHKRGHYLWLETTVRAVRDPKTGMILDIQASSREITDRKQAEEKQQFLVQASSILSSSLDYETTLTNLSRLMVPAIADWCVVDLVATPIDSLQNTRRVAVAHANPAKQCLVEQLRQYPPDLQQAGGLAEIIRTGRSLLSPEVSAEQLQSAAQNSEHLNLLQALNPRSGMSVPLIARGQVLGAISLAISDSDRQYKVSDLLLAEELAHRAAVAVDNARLYQEARRSQQAAERAAVRTSRLQALTAALSESVTLLQVADVIAQHSLSALAAMASFVALLTPDGAELEIVRTIGSVPYPDHCDPADGHAIDMNVGQKFSIDAPLLLATAVRTKRLQAGTLPTTQPVFGSEQTTLESLAAGFRWFAIPLIIEARAVGGIVLAFSRPQTLNQEDQSFIYALALQCAQAIERARLYEAEQQARESAETANRLKDEFLAMLSHELRSPLNPILGWVRLLQTRSFNTATTRYALETIERNAKLQAQLVEDLLDVSRILRGKLMLNLRPVDLNAITRAALETARSAAAAKSIQIHTHFDPSLPPISGDANRLQQVVSNLLSNAVKFTPTEGWIEVRLARKTEDTRQEAESNTVEEHSSLSVHPSSFAEITVSDTGQGIPADFLPHVFDSFRQADGTTTRKFGGLGLGLAIVRQIVELHGGSVFADSEGEGQGATFTVRLPLPSDANRGSTTEPISAPNTNPLRQPPAATLTGLHILVVDDDANARELAANILQQSGACVNAAASATEALSLLDRLKPDILISDIEMPEVDGYRLLQYIRARATNSTPPLPAIALTDCARESDHQQALRAGFQSHVSKPIEPDALVNAVQCVLHRSDS